MLTSQSQLMHNQLLSRHQRLTAAIATDNHPDLEELLSEVDAALEKVEDGSHGLCAVCGDPVEDDRLAADPLVAVCLGCLSPAQSRALERDLELAARIQANLLPAGEVKITGWEVHHQYKPLGPVSGDFFDLIPAPRDEKSYFFLFGDVSGKGVSASLLMSHLQALFRSLVHLGLSLEELLDHANRLFCKSTIPSSYATLVAGRVDRSGSLEICNAGHCPPLLLKSGHLMTLPASALPFGLFASSRFELQRFELDPDDLLFLYTDGLSESTNERGEEYGTSRAGDVLRLARGLSAEAAAGICLEDVAEFRHGARASDDLTVMVIRRQE